MFKTIFNFLIYYAAVIALGMYLLFFLSGCTSDRHEARGFMLAQDHPLCDCGNNKYKLPKGFREQRKSSLGIYFVPEKSYGVDTNT